MAEQEIWSALGLASESDLEGARLPWFEPGSGLWDELDATRAWLAEFVEFIESVTCVADPEDEATETWDDWSLIDAEVLSFLGTCAGLDQWMLRGGEVSEEALRDLVDLGHAMILRVVLVPLAERHVVLLW